MKKIKTEVTFEGAIYTLTREVNRVRLFFNASSDDCIVVDKDGNVLFQIYANTEYGMGVLEDITD